MRDSSSFEVIIIGGSYSGLAAGMACLVSNPNEPKVILKCKHMLSLQGVPVSEICIRNQKHFLCKQISFNAATLKQWLRQ